ncbi:MAG: glycosyltransferase family 2 protein [Candidatus Omnitrophica bacterium]|nr:glycosyltransferase family 2 protein [Candidatus Omnitrophota bacterium]
MTKSDFPQKIKYSLIIPFFNEEHSVEPLFDSLKKVMNGFKEDYEVIFINDGSRDNTLSLLECLSRSNDFVRVISFDTNRGQGKAIEEGFRNVRGDVVITMDGDLQNDPVDIPMLTHKIDQGFDLVCGWRYLRNDTVIKKIKSKIGNFFQRKITGLNIHDISCTMRAYRREIIKEVVFYGEFEFSVLPYIISRDKNIKITEVKVKDNYRKFGKSKYRTLRTIFGTMYDYIRLIVKNKR